MFRDRTKGIIFPPHALHPSTKSSHLTSFATSLTNLAQIDYDKFHKLAGLASVHSARELMRVTKNKLKSEYGALGADLQAANSGTNTPSKTQSKSASGTPRKSASATPAKRKRSAGKKAREEVEDDSEGDVDGQSSIKKVKKERAAPEDIGEMGGEVSD